MEPSSLTLRGLAQSTGGVLQRYVPGTSIQGVQFRRNRRRFTYRCAGSEPWSNPNGFLASVLFPEVRSRHGTDRSILRDHPEDYRATVYCTCPAFQFWGPAYHATEYGYRIFDKDQEFRPPDVRDPKGEHFCCKHIIVVANRLRGHTFNYLYSDFDVAVAQPRRRLGAAREALGQHLADNLNHSDEEADEILASVNPSNFEEVAESFGAIPPDQDPE